MARISIIVARASNGVIGHEGKMPWHLPEDLAHFKRTTMGAPIIMGRKTWESIGRPLPGRRNLVITRNAGYDVPGAELQPSLRAALERCKEVEEIFVIGGGQIYAEALLLADRLVLTEIGKPLEGDTRFPDFDKSLWREASREMRRAPPPLDCDYAFVDYRRG
ncbi:MAG: dihydrofolate reductase [Candidatus Protistobacter heckmanni]|nr:dihydrofolate reductase [Candidatus Protistobacter heckmanni]